LKAFHPSALLQNIVLNIDVVSCTNRARSLSSKLQATVHTCWPSHTDWCTNFDV